MATLSLLVQFLPVGPVGFDHVDHRLKFGIQLDQSLEEETERGRKMRIENTTWKDSQSVSLYFFDNCSSN